MPGTPEQQANPLADLVETVKNDKHSGKYPIKIDPKKYGFKTEEEYWRRVRQLAGVPESRKQGLTARVGQRPHYLIQSSNLAAWIMDQGEETWWCVDGDPLLMGRLEFPCPPEELAKELQKINRPLLVSDPDAVGDGAEVTPEDLSRLVETEELGVPCLFLSWQDGSVDWLLIKDQPTKG